MTAGRFRAIHIYGWQETQRAQAYFPITQVSLCTFSLLVSGFLVGSQRHNDVMPCAGIKLATLRLLTWHSSQ